MTTSPLLGGLDFNASQATALEPVMIVHSSDHLFELKKGTKTVCRLCGEGRFHPAHGLMSFNRWGSGANRHVYQATKKAWQEAWGQALDNSSLSRCSSIEALGRISFPADPPGGKARDEENYRYPLSKFLADALVKESYLRDDDWSSFRFRELDLMPNTPGVQRVEVMLLPTAV